MTDKWEFLDEDVELDRLMKKCILPAKIMELPACPVNERYKIEQQNLTLAEAIASPNIKLLAKQRIQRFKDKAFKQIDQIKVIDVKQMQSANKKKAS